MLYLPKQTQGFIVPVLAIELLHLQSQADLVIYTMTFQASIAAMTCR